MYVECWSTKAVVLLLIWKNIMKSSLFYNEDSMLMYPNSIGNCDFKEIVYQKPSELGLTFNRA